MLLAAKKNVSKLTMRIRRRIRVPMPVMPVVPVRVRIGRIAVALEDLGIRSGRGQHMVPLQIQLVVPMVGTELLLVVVWIPTAATTETRSSHTTGRSKVWDGSTSATAQSERVFVLFPVPA